MINISESGAKIPRISHMIDDFKLYDADADDVEKVVLCLGTNDIKHAKNGVAHLKNDMFKFPKELCAMHYK